MRCQQCAKYEIIIQRMGHDLNDLKTKHRLYLVETQDYLAKKEKYVSLIQLMESRIKILKTKLKELKKD